MLTVWFNQSINCLVSIKIINLDIDAKFSLVKFTLFLVELSQPVRIIFAK